MTAIDYLVEQLQKEYKWFPSTQSELIIKAKEMEKEQVEESYAKGFNDASPTCNKHRSMSIGKN